MSKHVGFPSERLVFKVIVSRTVIKDTQYGKLCEHTMVTDDGNVLYWAATEGSGWLQEGQSYSVKATIKMHDRDEAGTLRTIVLRVVEYREPPRIPLMAVGLSRGGARRR